MANEFATLLDDAGTELREVFSDGIPVHPEDTITEIADSQVPVYDGDLIAMAADSLELATREPECGPAFDKATPTNTIRANIFEALVVHLHDVLAEMQEEIDEAEEEDDEQACDINMGTWIDMPDDGVL